jgi:hypothetical protein
LAACDEVQVGEGVGLEAARCDAEVLQQLVADQMRHLAHHVADAQIHVRLAEVDGHQLGMAVGDVQQADVAEARQVVHLGGRAWRPAQDCCAGHAAGAGDGQHLEEFAAIHGHAVGSIVSLC